MSPHGGNCQGQVQECQEDPHHHGLLMDCQTIAIWLIVGFLFLIVFV